MSENFEFKAPGEKPNIHKEEEISIMSILGRLDKISEEDREGFRNKVLDYTVDIFDDMSEDGKNIMVLLDACSDVELIYLMNHDKNNGRALIIHDINQRLTVLEGLLADGRVDRLKV